MGERGAVAEEIDAERRRKVQLASEEALFVRPGRADAYTTADPEAYQRALNAAERLASIAVLFLLALPGHGRVQRDATAWVKR